MRRINACLNPTLLSICQQTIQLETLNATLNAYLPSALQSRCHVGSFHKGLLVLVVHDTAWATPLRYALPELRDQLRQQAGLYQLKSIDIRIGTPEPLVQHTKQPKKNTLSITSRQAIMASGDQCQYEPLKQVLYRLGKRSESE